MGCRLTAAQDTLHSFRPCMRPLTHVASRHLAATPAVWQAVYQAPFQAGVITAYLCIARQPLQGWLKTSSRAPTGKASVHLTCRA